MIDGAGTLTALITRGPSGLGHVAAVGEIHNSRCNKLRARLRCPSVVLSNKEVERMSVRIAAVIAAAVATLGTTAITLAPPASACPSGYYKAASGDCVHRPVCNSPTQPPGATAVCADGCYTFSEHPNDDYTCHGHGGVAQ